ncbi:hypothetical protein GGI20_000955 [Coemansia sp. BCRC 34301]|nr:hypothetical protein GGI20_000955 [Coemansia sp. BCRC 34301]
MFTSPSVRTRRRVVGSGVAWTSQSQEALTEHSPLFTFNDDDAGLTQETTSGEGPHTLLHGDRHAVFEVGALPPAAAQLLGSSDSVACGLSSTAQFAFVATGVTCAVWSFAAGSSAEVHLLAMPDAGDLDAPAVALVAGVGAGDVGVVAVSRLGSVRYWDRVVFGLGGTDCFHCATLALSPSDQCEQIAEASAGLFVVATRAGCLFRLSLHPSLEVRQLSRTAGARAGMLSRMASLLGGSAGAGGSDDRLVAVARGARTEIRHSREMYTLTRSRLDKWVVSSAHTERLVYSLDLRYVLADALAPALGPDFSVYDVSGAGSDACVLAGAGGRLAVALLRAAHVAAEPSVAALTLLGYAVPHQLAQLGSERPRLIVPADNAAAAFVVLGQTVVAVALGGSPFEEAVTLRSGDCVLAACAVDTAQPDSCVLLACRRAGILRMAAAVCQASDSSAAGAGSPQQEQIEQAVFFGLGAQPNPLAFAIASDSDGPDLPLQAAALRVSQAILDGSSRFVADRLDVGALLRERLRRAHAVAQALADNHLTEKLSPAARAQLCANAEKLAAAQALWRLQNAAWGSRTGPAVQLLANLAAAFLEATGQHSSQPKDPLRLFFRLHCAVIGDLLALMHRRLPALTRALAVSPSGIKDSHAVSYEASRIAAAVLQPALAYRFQHAALYAISGDPSLERWTELPAIADLLVDRLEASYALCRHLSASHCQALYDRITATALPGDERSDGHALSIFDDAVSVSYASLSSDDDDDGKLLCRTPDSSDDPYASPLALMRETIDQIGPLANLCFRVFVDRIARLAASNSTAAAHDLSQRYDTIRPRYLLCLVPLRRAPVAFRLAEEYRDLASLVTLVFVADPTNAAVHLRRYIDCFGKDFADTLFAFYERRAAWASLLHIQDAKFEVWLKDFIDLRVAEHPHGPLAQVGWIHDVKIADFGAAATRLARAGRDAKDIDHARTMLSLSKLAFFALESQELRNGHDADDRTMAEAHSRLEDALELCQVQAHLLLYFTALLRRDGGNADSRKAAYDAALHTTTPELRHSHPALYIVFSELVRRLWDRHTLPVEDLIDLLTFPDNLHPLEASDIDADEHNASFNAVICERFSLAVHILSCASVSLPEQTRESALRSIWRRVFLSDNWPQIHRNTTGNIPDSVLRSELLGTNLYRVIHSCWTARELAHPDWYLLPANAFASPDNDYLVSTRLMPQFGPESAENIGKSARQEPLATTTALALTNDYADEDRHLQAAIDCGIDDYYSEILRIVVEQASTPKEDGDSESLESDYESDVQMDTD